ncbi:hypothetical protein [Halomarina oriensis]|uniref:Uncharacterized protein n=1 Tax=Halomarina oriensis TaxID=671145 RepID=A0A6B0GI79_9EURY|nr:hypothetical protein [Halomarina oriensis]MWG34572.1 hypothetical protein [Halomarina oriensis]
MNLAYLLGFGLLVALPVGAFVYRDSALFDGKGRLPWALGAALVTGVGAALSFAYSSQLVFAATRIIRGEAGVTNPWTVPFTYVMLTAVVVVLTIIGYWFGVRATTTRRRDAA